MTSNFEHIANVVLLFAMLNLNKKMLAGEAVVHRYYA